MSEPKKSTVAPRRVAPLLITLQDMTSQVQTTDKCDGGISPRGSPPSHFQPVSIVSVYITGINSVMVDRYMHSMRLPASSPTAAHLNSSNRHRHHAETNLTFFLAYVKMIPIDELLKRS
jgi:hypothetical protein|eukprot:scaffold800_cov197-Alexandrium_tamarense.AAC.35